MQKSTFLIRKQVFKCSFYEIGEQVVTNLSTLLEKYLTIEILHRVDFLRILKNIAFSKFFEIF